jgi:hypothetical protein
MEEDPKEIDLDEVLDHIGNGLLTGSIVVGLLSLVWGWWYLLRVCATVFLFLIIIEAFRFKFDKRD